MKQSFAHDPFSLSSEAAIVVGEDARQPMPLPKKTSHARQGPDQKNLGEDALLLLSIRKEMGMTQADFAIALGEPKERLVNIENARVKKVPKSMLEAAKALKEDEQRVRSDPLSDIKELTMNQIINRWKEMVRAQDDDECAVLLGTSRTAMKRWRSEANRPAVSDLLRYETVARRIRDRFQAESA